ncbi:GNAT family N-acetyltransferase [Sphingomonas lenta]|uniref:GNAT family N-acetyltransferase n=1 Tax=Sphingomonas lenta TaxID=1141887 RepID=UPI001FE7D3CB|nr:GNAT family N-acetyltransferase [Sphingomonas lenta]
MSAEFESERLRFRPQRIEDAEALHEAYRDEALMRYWSSAPHRTLDDTVAYLTPSGEGRGWSIVAKETGEVTGTLFTSERRSGVSEIGYLLVRRHWGRGYAREAVARLLDLLFLEEGRRRVFADTDPENGPSIRLLESLGFRREGLLRAEWETHIGVRDSVVWGLLRDEWKARWQP